MQPKRDLASLIYSIRGRKVMLSNDLALLYGIRAKALVQAVKRNRQRFPSDFMFRLTSAEVENLRSQSVTSSWGGPRWLPHAFTEQGVAMLSAVLHSPVAIQANIAIMRTFVQVRELAARDKRLSSALDELARRVDRHDAEIARLIDSIRDAALPEPERRRIGFSSE